MALKDKLLDDLKNAMKDKDSILKNTVQMARAAVLQVEKDKKTVLDDDGVIEIIAKELKKRKDSLPEYEKSGRQDLILDLKREIEILQQYLPAQLTEEELLVLVREAVQATGAVSVRDMGKVMQEVMPKLKGRADGRMVNQAVKKIFEA